jgi:hypothetical protein
MKTWLVDTGPLVAYLRRSDPHNQPVAHCLHRFGGQLCTTSAVLTEAMYLVSGQEQGPRLLAEFIKASRMMVYDLAQPDSLLEAAQLMAKYHDTPMDFADATLVLLAAKIGVLEILTLDGRGFRVFRTSGGKAFHLVLQAG